LFQTVNGQKIFFDCELLEKSIETDAFQKHFFIRKDSNQVLMIVDTAKYFNDCYLPNICQRKVQISRIYPDGISPNKSNNRKEDFYNIILFRADRTGNLYHLFFWQPRNNGGMQLELVKRKNYIKVKVINSGVW